MPYTDATPVRDHLTQLTAWGMTPPMIADATHGHVYRDTVRRLLAGRSTTCTTFVADQLLAVGPQPTPDARLALPIGAQRRIHALQRRGWTMAAIDTHIGAPRGTCGQILLRREPITHRRWQSISNAYDQLSPLAAPGPSRQAALTAERRRWPAPLDWETVDIDHPDAWPEPTHDTRDTEAATLRREAVAALTRAGYSARQIATRLNVTQRTIVRDRGHLAPGREAA